MKNILVLSFTFFQSLTLFAGDLVYPVSDIPDSLKTNAYAVIRKEETILEYNNISSAKTYNYKAITILNKNGDACAVFNEMYNKFIKLSDIKITIYDANGKKIKKVKSDDIIDHSAVSGFSLYEDTRGKYYEPIINSYPYTAVIEYTETHNGIMGLPTWYFHDDNNVSVQYSGLKLKVKEGINFRHKEYFCNNPTMIKSIDGYNEYLWTAHNLKAYENESYMPDIQTYFPRVVLAPNDFELDGRKGNMETWENLGKWLYDLNEQPNVISDKTKVEIIALTKDCKSDFDKIKILYKYMQDKTRYVSIQIGIGGLKAFDASITDKYNYGDCKALSNYLQALLKEVGINSYSYLINSGDNESMLNYDLPRDVFNHAKLIVPLQNDTINLECTSQHCPFGYAFKSTTDRPALMITPEGGKLIYIKAPKALENLQSRKVDVKIDNSGLAKLHIHTFYHGLQYEDLFKIVYLSQDEQKKWLYNNLDVTNIKINSFSFKPDNQPKPIGEENVDAELNDYLSISGKRFFLPLNMLNKYKHFPSTTKSRKFDFSLKYAYNDIDTVVYELPQGLKVENILPETNLTTKYGSYHSKVLVEENRITYIRSIVINKGQFPAKEFDVFADFMKQIAKADGAKLSLLRNLN